MSRHSVMLYRGNREFSQSIDLMPELREVYDVIRSAVSDFEKTSDYLPWLSDVTRRINCGMAVAGIYQKSSVALVSHIGCGYAHISHVATIPEFRKNGNAGILVSSLAALMKNRGLSAFVEPRDASLNHFYSKLGFELFEDLIILTTSEEHI